MNIDLRLIQDVGIRDKVNKKIQYTLNQTVIK